MYDIKSDATIFLTAAQEELNKTKSEIVNKNVITAEFKTVPFSIQNYADVSSVEKFTRAKIP